MLNIREMSLSDKTAFENFAARYREECGTEAPPFGLNPDNLPYEEFYGRISRLACRDTLPEGWVLTRYYLLRDGDELVGAANIRCEDSDFILNHAGHIGYAVAQWKRNQGIASAALGMLLPIAGSFGLERVVLTCDHDNEPSKRVIMKNGGTFVRRSDAKEFYIIRL